MKLGIIGTSWISHEFARGAALAGFTIGGVMSRDKARGEAFLAEYGGGTVCATIEEMAADHSIDVVYIASPNVLHYTQSIALIRAGKHVLVEKPCYMSLSQLDEVLSLAKEKSVYVLETMRSLYSPVTEKVREALPLIGPLRHVYFNWMVRSTRYDAFQAGELPSVFDKKMGGGALNDLGVYLIYACLDLFGSPSGIDWRSIPLDSGVDGVFDLMLGYEGFHAILSASKISTSQIDSEIQGEDGSILIKPLFLRGEVVWKDNAGNTTVIIDGNAVDDMYMQQKALLDILKGEDEAGLARAHQFMRESTMILERCRAELGG